MQEREAITVHYHRDFDGMVAGAVLSRILRDQLEERVQLASVNYDQRENWLSFEEGKRFAIVDFHFHPRAEYWFDHHPTTFLSPELREAYEPSERWSWDVDSPSCPPLILRHARQYWDYEAPERFVEMAHWSDIVDAARYEDVEQAVFGDTPALRIARSLTVAPSPTWLDEIAEAMTEHSLDEIASRPDVERAHQRASRNRDKALEQFPPTVEWKRGGVLLYDASSSRIRRERFAVFYHHPDLFYSVGVIPTRSGFHITCGENPWNPPPISVHVGELMETYGGGGHRAVGGANPPNLQAARKAAAEVAEKLVSSLAAH
jgi:oligoribonuclease NrnB/cAMP/cGMP phosphodiesterase (DHH superfamily)